MPTRNAILCSLSLLLVLLLPLNITGAEHKLNPRLAAAEAGLVPIIVEYKDGTTPDKQFLEYHNCSTRHVLKSLHGIAAECPPEALGWISENADVAQVWEDEILQLTLDQTVPLINATISWASFGNGTGINVSIIDSGINTSHPGLAGQVILQRDFTPENFLDDRCNHGTPVACVVGCIDATYKGVAPGAKLFNAKVARVLNENPLVCGVSSSDAIAAIDWSIANGAQVIQLSMGSPASSCYQSPISVAINRTAQNITIVIPAGNTGPSDQTINVPGCAENALTVGASNEDTVESYSSRGPTDYGAQKPDIVAPGTLITAATNDGVSFSSFTGTSFASPHVAGVVALMLQHHKLMPDQVKAILKDTAINLSFPENAQGAGLVDAWAAVNETLSLPNETCTAKKEKHCFKKKKAKK